MVKLGGRHNTARKTLYVAADAIVSLPLAATEVEL